MKTRRQFLGLTSMALAASQIDLKGVEQDEHPLFGISLAQWTIVKELRSGKIDNLEFAEVASAHGIRNVEYVNQFWTLRKPCAYSGHEIPRILLHPILPR